MSDKDFFGSEKSVTVSSATEARIEFVDSAGAVKVLKQRIPLTEGEVVDCAVMNVAALRKFYAEQIAAAKADNALFSLHLKCTMMKVSDPIMFGHCVAEYFADALQKHAGVLAEIGANVNNGLADVLSKLDQLPAGKKAEIEADIAACYEERPGLAMVDSRAGKTNLHVPSDVIIDASMPVVIRDGGKMWNKEDALQDTVAVIPDRCYATIYQAVIEDCKQNGQFDPATMGSVSNVGLMAQKAEEYGSHDKTFVAPGNGTIRIVDDGGKTLLEQSVERGDIFRACQTKDEPIRDWVKLGVTRARATGTPAVFWLDPDRGHDAQIIQKVKTYLAEHDLSGLEIKIMKPVDAMKFSLERIRRGEDTISVTGNVLRDYLTDLFPILELGTSARMLSIVPLLQGGAVVRNRSRRFGAQARAAVGERRSSALGLARGVLCAGAIAGTDGDKKRQPARGAPFENAGRGHRPVPRRRPLPLAEGERDRQPRFDVLSRVGVGKGTRRPGRGRGFEATLHSGSRRAGGGRGQDHAGVVGGAGQTSGHRGVLFPGRR